MAERGEDGQPPLKKMKKGVVFGGEIGPSGKGPASNGNEKGKKEKKATKVSETSKESVPTKDGKAKEIGNGASTNGFALEAEQESSEDEDEDMDADAAKSTSASKTSSSDCEWRILLSKQNQNV